MLYISLPTWNLPENSCYLLHKMRARLIFLRGRYIGKRRDSMGAVYRSEAHRTEPVLAVSTGETLTAQVGLGHGWCVTKGDVLMEYPSQCLPCYACSTSSSFPPCSMPQTHRPFGSKQGSPHRPPGWTEGAGPSRKGYPIQGPPDGEEQTRRAHECAWVCRSGTSPPHRVPCAQGRAPFHRVCGLSRTWRPPSHHLPADTQPAQLVLCWRAIKFLISCN